MKKGYRIKVIFGQVGKLCLDLAKIVFGGILVAGIMQDEGLSSSIIFRIFAVITAIALATVGLMFFYYAERSAK